MIIKNARIFDENFDIISADIEISGDKISKIADNLCGDNCIDISGCLAAPGFVDIHIHGCSGADTCDASCEALSTMASHLIKNGVTSFCPTTMTVEPSKLEAVAGIVKNCMENPPEGASVCGINMEGPYISPQKKGAQKEEYIKKPDIESFRRFYEKFGEIVKLIDIAPECDDSGEFVRSACKLCTVSIAHSCADYETAKNAFQSGITHVTHLFNAMTGFKQREPGIVGAVFDDSTVCAELICDGLHVHPAVLRTAFKILGENRTIIISDSMRAAGMPDGLSELGGQQVFIKNGEARLKDGTLAGSTTNILDEVKNLIAYGVPLRQVIKSATINPSAAIGKDDQIGSIKVGKTADIIVFEDDFKIKFVLHKGRIVDF